MTGTGAPRDPDADLVVVGGGIAGLVIARDAAISGLRVVLLESAPEWGGLLRRAELDGIPLDIGAESFATRTSGVADLVADLTAHAAAGDEALEIVKPSPGGAHLAAVVDGIVLRAPLPRRTVLGIPADPLADDVIRIVGVDAARRIAAEPTLTARRDDADAEPTLAALVAERCGEELVRRLVDPLCRSVYSAPADRVHLSRLSPPLWQAYLESGSLVAAAASLAGPQRAGAAVAGIAGGMWRLADAVARDAVRHGADLRTGARVDSVTPETEGAGDTVVVRADGATLRTPSVVIATGPSAARRLRGLPALASPAVAVTAALVRAPAFDAHPVGSGVIVAADVPSRAKALTHVTAKWDWASASVPAGHHLFRLSARDADARQDGVGDPATDLAGDITLLTGVAVAPSDVVAVTGAHWTDAVASAPVTPEEQSALAARGIHFAGAAVAGTGLASVVPHARALARHLAAGHRAAAPVSSLA